MDYASFTRSLFEDTPPVPVSSYLLALWHDARGDWNSAHEIIQHIDTEKAVLVHAYLHRKEGDIFNANYWYKRAGIKMPDISLEDEWEHLVHEFL